MQALTLYQFELCPFCHKVKAALEVKGIPYTKVEVSPYNKKQLPELPEGTPRKVPVIQHEGRTIQDSTEILRYIAERFQDTIPLLPNDDAARRKAEEIEHWVDDDLAQLLPVVIYGNRRDAAVAARATAATSNLNPAARFLVRTGGTMIMRRVAKRILERRGGGDPNALFAAELDRFEQWLGDQPFVCGQTVSLGDVAAHGAFSAIKDLPAFAQVLRRPVLSAWFDRVQSLREENRAAA